MSDFNTQIIEEFRANGGKVAGMFAGSNMIVITVKGAKSGKLYEIPLVYAPDGDKFLIIGSYGGSDVHPAWYRNILANPRFKVEVGEEVFEVNARDLEGDERLRGFEILATQSPGFRDYQAKTSRVIPVLELTRAG